MINLSKNKKDEEVGFTLIELMIVVVIIGILAAVAIPIFMNQQKGASVATVKSDLKNAALSMQTAATKNNGKYSYSLPADFSPSKGNTVYVSSDANNSNLAAGTTSSSNQVNLGRVGHNNSSAYTITKTAEYTQDTYTSSALYSSGPYWDYQPGATIPTGTQFTYSLTVKSTEPFKLKMGMEQKGTGGKTQDLGTVNVTSDWATYTFTGTTTVDNPYVTFIAYSGSAINPGMSFYYKSPVVVAGDSIGEYVNSSPDSKFCVEGYSEAAPDEIWSYSILKNGLKKGKC